MKFYFIIFRTIHNNFNFLVCVIHAGGNALSKIFSADQPKSHGPPVGVAVHTIHVHGYSRSAVRLRDSGSMFLAPFMLYPYLPR